jgi:hypothetical protein
MVQTMAVEACRSGFSHGGGVVVMAIEHATTGPPAGPRLAMKAQGAGFYFWYYLLPMIQHRDPAVD